MRAMHFSKLGVMAATLLVAVGSVLLVACDEMGLSVSLHPIASDVQPQFEPALLGRWKMIDGDDVLEFEKTVTGQYRLLIFKQSSLDADPDAVPEERFAVQAVRLGRFVFLDLSEPSGSDGLLRIPAHLFMRLDVNGDQFELAPLNDRWLRIELQEKRLDLAHEVIRGQVVITATPAELRKFLEGNAWNEEAFPPDARYRRVSPANAAPAPRIDSSQ